MTDYFFPQFRDELELTQYPFVDNATLTTTDGTLILQNDTFLDASLYPIGAAAHVYISSITLGPDYAIITLGDAVSPEIATATFNPLSPPVLLAFADKYERAAGILVSDSLRLSRFTSWPVGTHTFSAAATEFAASCVISMPDPGVRGLATPDGLLYVDDIWIVGDNGVVVREDGEGTLRIDVVGDPLFMRKLCSPINLFNPPLFVTTINSCPPDNLGNFNLIVGANSNAEPVLRIYADTDGLHIDAAGATLSNR